MSADGDIVRAALEEVEWGAYKFIGLEPCPACSAERVEGHRATCAIPAGLAALARLEAAEADCHEIFDQRSKALLAQRDALAEALRDAAVVIERMANGATRAECSPELDRVIAALAEAGLDADGRASVEP